MADLTGPEIRQIPGPGRARYQLLAGRIPEPSVCRSCGGDIVDVFGRWYALEGRWPNLAHCHYSAGDGTSRGHAPDG